MLVGLLLFFHCVASDLLTSKWDLTPNWQFAGVPVPELGANITSQASDVDFLVRSDSNEVCVVLLFF